METVAHAVLRAVGARNPGHGYERPSIHGYSREQIDAAVDALCQLEYVSLQVGGRAPRPRGSIALGAVGADRERAPTLGQVDPDARMTKLTLDSPTDKIMLSLTAFADELEREKARQRTRDAMVRKAQSATSRAAGVTVTVQRRSHRSGWQALTCHPRD